MSAWFIRNEILLPKAAQTGARKEKSERKASQYLTTTHRLLAKGKMPPFLSSLPFILVN
jgi:hypothetical protein